MFTQRGFLLSLLALMGVASCIPMVSRAQTFFGEDLNNSDFVRLTATPHASAAQTTFLSSLSGSGVEDFEGFTAGTPVPLHLTFPGSLSTSIQADLTGEGWILNLPTGTDWSGVYPISGNNALKVVGANFQIDVDTPVVAFGFFGVDIGDVGGQLSLEFSNSGIDTRTLTVPHTIGSDRSTTGSVFYYGLIDTIHPFTRVRFLNSSTVDYFGFDDMTIGDLRQATSVPEPNIPAVFGFFCILGHVAFCRKTTPRQITSLSSSKEHYDN